MKKMIIAGAASAVLAAMPIVGAFAVTQNYGTIQDTLEITIVDSCGMIASATNGGTSNQTNGYSYAQTLTANKEATSLGITTLKVTCNLPTGYTVTGNFSDLDNQQTDQADRDIKFSTTAATKGSAVWNAKVNSSSLAAKTNATIMSKTDETSAAAGDTTTIEYIVSTADDQASGTYKATARYVLTGTPAMAADPNPQP